MVEQRRVVVTGIGVVSPIGNNQKEVKDSLFYNKSGISFSKDYYDLGFRSHIHGDININFEDFLEKKDLRFMGDGAAYTAIAMKEAIQDANLNDELISMLLLNIEADVSVRKLDSLIRSISLWCRMHQSSPTCEAIKLAVESGAKTKNISLSKITSAVAKHFKIRSSEIRSGSRKQKLVRARSLAMLLARQLTTKTMLQIGNFYGGRDHTTVLHALRSTEEKLAKDSQLAHALDSIKDQLSR